MYMNSKYRFDKTTGEHMARYYLDGWYDNPKLYNRKMEYNQA